MSVLTHHSTPRSRTSAGGRVAVAPSRPLGDVRLVQALALFVAAGLVAIAVVMGA